ncbi:hypothetical protein TorRG33x02_184400 [Trema orientale]|uniref:Uncharacterized protein n=1 Tax=Trema orientale TaxID=63057 RepID=A0A2P5EJW3_TREOI|nr:hypothetical protein TorRG33x02_184400 [Trema orientale]
MTCSNCELCYYLLRPKTVLIPVLKHGPDLVWSKRFGLAVEAFNLQCCSAALISTQHRGTERTAPRYYPLELLSQSRVQMDPNATVPDENEGSEHSNLAEHGEVWSTVGIVDSGLKHVPGEVNLVGAKVVLPDPLPEHVKGEAIVVGDSLDDENDATLDLKLMLTEILMIKFDGHLPDLSIATRALANYDVS